MAVDGGTWALARNSAACAGIVVGLLAGVFAIGLTDSECTGDAVLCAGMEIGMEAGLEFAARLSAIAAGALLVLAGFFHFLADSTPRQRLIP